jgi:mono/diheme cytochrome c family protein
VRLLKWLGILVVAVVALVVVAAGVLFAVGANRIANPRAVEVDGIPVPTDSASIAEGRRLSTLFGCRECHGERLEGKSLVNDPVLGHLVSPHIAPGEGSVTAGYTETDWVRALRNGIARNGRALIIMPADQYTHAAREDLGPLIAYLMRAEPVDHVPPKTALRLATILIGAGAFPLEPNLIDHGKPAPQKPAPEDTMAFGSYMSLTCRACHGQDLMGSAEFGGPPLGRGSVLDTYDEAAFGRMLDTGVTPNGRTLDPAKMPWRALGVLTPAERHAVWSYLKTVTAPAPE